MIYINEVTLEYPVTESEIRERFKSTVSFKTPFEPVDPYKEVELCSPNYNPDTQKVFEAQPIFVDGVWLQTWKVVDLTEEEKKSFSDFLLATAKQELESKILASCQLAIVSGFKSSALGTEHEYPSGLIDQQNLAAGALSALKPGLPSGWVTQQWCSRPDGFEGYVDHNAEQIWQVAEDGKSLILSYRIKKQRLFDAIASAKTLEDLSAISWD